MLIFISWAGRHSKSVAEPLREWLTLFFENSVTPWMSEKDIGPGTLWNVKIKEVLQNAQIAILCITTENLIAPWIIYEAGAISNSLDKTLIIPYLIDVSPENLPTPLTQFQSSLSNKEGTFKIIKTINSLLGDTAYDPMALKNRFNDFWPHLYIEIEKYTSKCVFINDLYDTWGIAQRMVRDITEGGYVYDTTSVVNTERYEDEIEKIFFRGANITRIIASDDYSSKLNEFIRKPSIYEYKNQRSKLGKIRILHYPFPNIIDILISRSGARNEAILGLRSSDDPKRGPQYNSAIYTSSVEITNHLREIFEKIIETKSLFYSTNKQHTKICNICQEILFENNILKNTVYLNQKNQFKSNS